MRNLIRLGFMFSLVVGKELLAPTQVAQGDLKQRMDEAGRWKSDVDQYLAASAASEAARQRRAEVNAAVEALPGQESEARSSLASEEQAAREAMARDLRLGAMGSEEENRVRALVGLPPLPVKPAAAKVVQSEVAPVVTTPRGSQWAPPGGVLPLIGSPRVISVAQSQSTSRDPNVAEVVEGSTQSSPRRAEAFFGGEGAQPEQPRVRPAIPPLDTAKAVRVARAEALAEEPDLTGRMDRLAEAIRPPVPGIAISGAPTSSFPDVRPRAGRAAAGSDQQAATLPAQTRAVEESIVLPPVRPGTAMRPGPAAPAAATAEDPVLAARRAAAQRVSDAAKKRAGQVAAQEVAAKASAESRAAQLRAIQAASDQSTLRRQGRPSVAPGLPPERSAKREVEAKLAVNKLRPGAH